MKLRLAVGRKSTKMDLSTKIFWNPKEDPRPVHFLKMKSRKSLALTRESKIIDEVAKMERCAEMERVTRIGSGVFDSESDDIERRAQYDELVEMSDMKDMRENITHFLPNMINKRSVSISGGRLNLNDDKIFSRADSSIGSGSGSVSGSNSISSFSLNNSPSKKMNRSNSASVATNPSFRSNTDFRLTDLNLNKIGEKGEKSEVNFLQSKSTSTSIRKNFSVSDDKILFRKADQKKKESEKRDEVILTLMEGVAEELKYDVRNICEPIIVELEIHNNISNLNLENNNDIKNNSDDIKNNNDENNDNLKINNDIKTENITEENNEYSEKFENINIIDKTENIESTENIEKIKIIDNIDADCEIINDTKNNSTIRMVTEEFLSNILISVVTNRINSMKKNERRRIVSNIVRQIIVTAAQNVLLIGKPAIKYFTHLIFSNFS